MAYLTCPVLGPSQKAISNQQAGKLPRPIVVAAQPVLFPKIVAQGQQVGYINIIFRFFANNSQCFLEEQDFMFYGKYIIVCFQISLESI